MLGLLIQPVESCFGGEPAGLGAEGRLLLIGDRCRDRVGCGLDRPSQFL